MLASPPSPTLPPAGVLEMGRPRSRSRTFSQAERDRVHERTMGEPLHPEEEISARELRAEMETLLSLRRRSLSQPAAADPDLPEPPVSPTHSSRPQLTLSVPSLNVNNPSEAPQTSPTAPSPAETGTLVRRKSSTASRLPSDHPVPVQPRSPPLTATLPSPPLASTSAAGSSPPPGDFFWLPASLHPELAPQEFKAFIREQTKPEALARRTSGAARAASGSSAQGRMERKKSTLRGEYKPSRGDGVGEGEEGVKRSSSLGGGGTQARRLDFQELTISDLQRLEELAAKAEAEGAKEGEGEGERLGRVLRRSLSLNPSLVAAAAAGAVLPSSTLLPDATPPSEDSQSPDSPLIVPPPGQILRRSARTKIRKTSLVGDGGGHRFGPSRRTRTVSGEQWAPASSTEDIDTVDDLKDPSPSPGGSVESGEAASVEAVVGRPVSESRETIVEEPEEVVSLPPARKDAALPPPPPPSPPMPAVSPTPSPSVHPSGPSPSSADFDWSTHRGSHQAPYSAVPSPSPPPVQAPQHLSPQQNRLPPPVSPPHSRPGSVKEKKSGWARLGLGSSSGTKIATGAEEEEGGKRKKLKGKEKVEPDNRANGVQNENISNSGGGGGLFGGLFGGKKKESDKEKEREREQQLLEEQQQRIIEQRAIQPPPPTASGALLPSGRYTNFYRLPIHVERAVYRLSHIKLANPRRPLYEQVLISNLMFWYLSIINKPAVPVPAAAPVPIPGQRSTEPPVPDNDPSSSSPPPSPSHGHAPAPAQKEKRNALTKQPDGRRSPVRNAEMPVRQPQYMEQNRQIQMEHEQQYRDHHYASPYPEPPPRPYPVTFEDGDDEEEDRPLAQHPRRRSSHDQARSSSPTRTSGVAAPTPITTSYRRPDFEVTSRDRKSVV